MSKKINLKHISIVLYRPRFPENIGAAARAMRDIIVDHARSKSAKKRGGGKIRISMDEAEGFFEAPSTDILAVHHAVKRLEEEDPRKGHIVNLRYFARMSTAETAAALGISTATVVRELVLSEGRMKRFLKRIGAKKLHIVILADEVTPALSNELKEELGNNELI